MVVFYCFRRQVYVFTFHQSSQNIVLEFVPLNCQILLLLTTGFVAQWDLPRKPCKSVFRGSYFMAADTDRLSYNLIG